MSGKKYQTILEAYNSIYEVASAPDPKLADKKPVNPESDKIAKDLFAKPSTIAAAPPPPTSSEKPVVKPETPPPTTSSEKPVVKPQTTPPPVVPAAPQKTFQQELDDLRKASAQATMAGPSREAQALMAQTAQGRRALALMGPEKLKAGIEGQERVERMKNEIGKPKIEAPKPQAPIPPATSSKPQQPPEKETRQPQPPEKENRQPQPPPLPKSDRSKEYQQAWDNRNNPFAKGRIKDAWSKMTPEEKQAAKDWAKANNKNWQEMDLPESVDLFDYLLEYLVAEGYADTNKAALVIMANMSEEWKQSIVEEQTKLIRIKVTPNDGKLPYFRLATPERIRTLESDPNIGVKKA